jgi:hypothetical protein
MKNRTETRENNGEEEEEEKKIELIDLPRTSIQFVEHRNEKKENG